MEIPSFLASRVQVADFDGYLKCSATEKLWRRHGWHDDAGDADGQRSDATATDARAAIIQLLIGLENQENK